MPGNRLADGVPSVRRPRARPGAGAPAVRVVLWRPPLGVFIALPEGLGEGRTVAQEAGCASVSGTEGSRRIDPAIRRQAQQLRRPLTPAEACRWHYLRAKSLGGLKFRKQHPLGRFILDFCCIEHKLAIELDGDSHAERVEYDQARTEWLQAQGYRVMRFNNRDVMTNVEGVVAEIARERGVSLS